MSYVFRGGWENALPPEDTGGAIKALQEISVRSMRAPGNPCGISRPAAAIGANPVSFNIDRRQRIAIAAGRVLYVFGL